MNRYHRHFAILATTLWSASTSSAMEAETPNYFHGVAKASETLAASVYTANPEANTISCALGPVQILETLHQALDAGETTIAGEIEQYVGHGITAEGLKAFKALTAAESAYTSLFLNNQYILPSHEGVNQEAIETLSELGSQIVPLDFSDAQGAADKINEIVARDTQQMIQSIANPQHFSDLTRAVFLSTLYVKAKWDGSFYDKKIWFKTSKPAKKIEGFKGCGYMFYSETKNDMFLTIPASSRTYMMIKLSKKEGRVSPITNEEWNAANRNKTRDFTEVHMPAFTIQNTMFLNTHLREAMPTLLGSDFQTTITQDPLVVSAILQKNKMVVCKDGLEACSVTMLAVRAMCSSSQPPVIKQHIQINRPFSFRLFKGIGINPETNGSKDFLCLFDGVINDPTIV